MPAPFLHLRSAPSGPLFRGTADLDTLLWDETAQAWYVAPSTPAPAARLFGIVQPNAVNMGEQVFPTQADIGVIVALQGDQFSYAGSSELALSPGGLLTYTGAPRAVLLELTGSFTGITPNKLEWEIAIAHNGDLLGAEMATLPTIAAGAGAVATPDGPEGMAYQLCATSRRRVVLASGDTLQPVAGLRSSSANLFPATLTFTVQEV